jgi:RNA polymerase sigma factor (sigma-70 family)
MSELELLAERFEQDRPHLRLVAQRILGSPYEADDAVQETWVRLSRSDTAEVGNLTGWLTTVVSRVCLDMLRARSARREEPADLPAGFPAEAAAETAAGEGADPEHAALMADAIGPALMLVLDTLGPAERLAFVLHDMFAVPFPEIATIVGCSPAAARQLASRARRRIQGTGPEAGDAADVARRRAVVAAFLAASQGGDFAALLEVLDPGVVLRADPAAVKMGANALVNGAQGVAETFVGRARAAEVAMIDGAPGLVFAVNGTPRVVFAFTIAADGRITGIDQVADPAMIVAMEVGA